MKGQYFSFDAIIASVIFVLALFALLSYWHSVRSLLDFQNEALGKDAVRVSNLFFTPPSPPEADCNSLERLGFAFSWDDRRVDEALLKCAETKDPGELKELLGTANNVSVEVENLANNEVTLIGGPVPAEVVDVVKIRRLATVVDANGDTYLATIDMSVYQEKRK